MNHVTRRDFLRYAGTGTAALLLGLPKLGMAAPAHAGDAPDVWIELTAAPRNVALRTGPATRVWSYRARVLKGDLASVQAWPRGDLGPMLRVQRG